MHFLYKCSFYKVSAQENISGIWHFSRAIRRYLCISSLSPKICFPSCEPGMIPWRSMDTKYTILDKVGKEPGGKYVTLCSVIDNIRNVASLFLGFHWNKEYFSSPILLGMVQHKEDIDGITKKDEDALVLFYTLELISLQSFVFAFCFLIKFH